MEKYGGDAEGRRLGTTQELYWTTCCVLMSALLGLLEIQFDGDPAGLREALSRVRPLNARFAYALGYYGALSPSCQYGEHLCSALLGLLFFFSLKKLQGEQARPCPCASAVKSVLRRICQVFEGGGLADIHCTVHPTPQSARRELSIRSRPRW
jgi:hypothetical protein